MRTFVLIILTILLLIFHTPACAYYKWYDEKGFVHYTQADPPADAKDEDGSSWWGTEPDQEEEKRLRKQRLQQIRLKIKNRNARKPKPGIKPAPPIKEDVSQKPEEDEPEDDNNEGFLIPSLSILKWWDSTRVDTGEATGPLYGVWGSSRYDVFVVGSGEGIPMGNNRFLIRGGIFHYNGHKWSEMSSSDDEFLDGIMLHAVWGSSSSNVYAVGSQWTILHYDGIEWSQIESGLYSDTGNDMGERSPESGFWSVWGSSANDIYAVGSSITRRGVALHFDGDYWSEIALSDNNRDYYHCVWGTSGKNVFILGALGRVYHYNGSTWKVMNIGQPVNLRAIWGTSNNDVFAAGYGGKIFHYDGEKWSEMDEFKGMAFSGIWGSSGKNVYVAGTRSYNDGVIYHYSGTKWKKIKTVNRVYLSGIWGNGAGDVFAVGTGNLILHYSGVSIFTSALGALSFGLGIFGWRFIRKLKK